MNKKVLWVLLSLLVFVIAVNIVARQYAGSLKKDAVVVTGSLKEIPKADEGPSAAVVDTEALARQGIVVVNAFNKPGSQTEWDTFMERLFEETKMLKTEDGQQVLRKKAINPAQFEETMARLDAETKKVEAAFSKDPNDRMLQRRLQDLQKMKAINKILVKEGVIDPTAPDLPSMPKAGAEAPSGT